MISTILHQVCRCTYISLYYTLLLLLLLIQQKNNNNLNYQNSTIGTIINGNKKMGIKESKIAINQLTEKHLLFSNVTKVYNTIIYCAHLITVVAHTIPGKWKRDFLRVV